MVKFDAPQRIRLRLHRAGQNANEEPAEGGPKQKPPDASASGVLPANVRQLPDYIDQAPSGACLSAGGVPKGI